MRGTFGDAGMIEIAGKVVVVAIVHFVFIVFFFFCLQFRATCSWSRRPAANTATRRHRRFDFATVHQEVSHVSALRRGLDPSILKTMPIMVFDPKEFKDGLECAVCMCEVSQGEKAKILPRCNHGFHTDCIDMWFQSHSTCPLCRSPVANQNQPNNGAESESALETILQAPPVGENSGVSFLSREAPNFPTNVLIWGNETQVRTFGSSVEESHQGKAIAEPSSSSSSSTAAPASSTPDGVSVIIDIPRQMNEEEDQKSPVPTRLRSLKRLLSSTRSVNPSSPRNLDQLEQGGRGQG